MNDDDDEYVPIERMRAQFESNVQTTEEKTQPITVKSIFKTLTCLSLGHDIANSLFDRKKNIDEQQISPIDEEFVIDGEHYRCLICFDYFAAHHVVQCKTNVGHMVCLACFRTNAEQHEKLCDIVCPERECATCYDDVTLDICLTEQLYQKLLQNQIKFDREIAMSSNVERALYCKCGFVAVVEKSETGDGCVRCVCGEVYCLKCGNYIHEGSLCPPPANTLRALDQKWINEHAKKCPNCAKPIEKNGGCNHMTCAQCKHEFCWICLGKWPGCKCK